MLRAAGIFEATHGHFPGAFDEQLDEDIPKLKAVATSLIESWGLSASVQDETVGEMCRFGAAELHPVASFVGGCAAQEIVKLLTNQYVPFKSTWILNSITLTSTTLDL